MQHKTNIEFISDVMDFSNQGALIQSFVLEGLRKYAELCVEAGPAKFDSSFLNGQAWINCAREYLTKLEEHYR